MHQLYNQYGRASILMILSHYKSVMEKQASVSCLLIRKFKAAIRI